MDTGILRWAWVHHIDRMSSMDVVREHYVNREPLGQTLRCMILEGHYVAGSENVKRQIPCLYRGDMHRNADGPNQVLKVFDTIPSRSSSRNKVFRPGSVENAVSMKAYSDSFSWLSESKVVLFCQPNTDPGAAMNPNDYPKGFRIHLPDTGLLITSAFDVDEVDERVFICLARSRLNINEFYRDVDDKHPHGVDFVLVRGRKITTVEVKPSSSNRHVSLDLFMDKFRSRISEAIIIRLKDLRVDRDITYLSIHMSSLL